MKVYLPSQFLFYFSDMMKKKTKILSKKEFSVKGSNYFYFKVFSIIIPLFFQNFLNFS